MIKKFNIEEMENYEINEIKDDLCMFGHLLEGTRDSDTVAKAFFYICYLEEKLIEIANSEERAKKLLKEKGYFVGKVTDAMERDWKMCERQNYEGDCSCCSCSICMMQ